jgi:hypothetical protein
MMTRVFPLMLPVACMALIPAPLHAQQVPAPTTVAKKCAPRAVVLQELAEKYSEVRQSIGMAGPAQVIEVFADPASGTWTIIATAANGMTCIVAAGAAYEDVADTLPPPGKPA